ncbi:MAG TPA: DNA ligase D [Rickettsiales bacterium]|nr:DNA ligase D [Rickettsiales bacterium]
MAKRSDSLKQYRHKRNFKITSEPEGRKEKAKGFHYLIQKHDATRLHYDFRLELDGVLKSWAVTRGPSLNPHDKRLAVEVEDHPVAYGSFEGTIPKGQYGGGTVMLWDQGSWEPIGDPHKQLAKGKLTFKLHGKRLKGAWSLVRMQRRPKDKHSNWLLIKSHDEEAQEEGDILLREAQESITTGRTMEQIATQKDRVWNSNKNPDKKSTPKPTEVKITTANGKKSAMPDFIPPELAQLTDRMPAGNAWIHEIKFDGYRLQAHLNNGKAKLLTRAGKDWTSKFPELARSLERLQVKNAIMDGEAVAVDDKGISSFGLLQQSLSEEETSGLQYYLFDLLYLNGKTLAHLPLHERKDQLKAVLAQKDTPANILLSDHFSEQDKEFFQHVCRLKLEGVISKRRDAAYRSGRNGDWVKTKCHHRQEFVIGGFTKPSNGSNGVGALLIGYFKDGKLQFASKVGTGFSADLSQDLRKKLEKKKQKSSAFVSVPAEKRRGALWVEPELVCEVEFTEWTKDGSLRHPSFQGLREDKPAKEVRQEETVAAPAPAPDPAPPAPSPRKAKTSGEQVAGIKISHPDRIIYEDSQITKKELAEYYAYVADRLLPHVKDRPLSILRCPEGYGSECFFQRHITQGDSPYFHKVQTTIKGKKVTYLAIKDLKGLISLVQWGTIELHPWGSLASDPLLPDRMIFDLDPDPEVPWKNMVTAAKEIRTRMEEFGLQSFLKTTGGKGLHVVVPLTRKYTWDIVKAFARAVAESMTHDNRKLYIATSSKEKRKGRIFIDYLRNDVTATAVAPFSVRARENATVSTPLAWEELTPSLDPKSFTLRTIPKRLEKLKSDPWETFFSVRQNIAQKHLKALNIAT